MAKIGRPSTYSREITAAICARLAAGESLTSICKDEGMPEVVTVYRWMQKHEEFSKDYARAREDQADTLADQILDCADDKSGDYLKNTDGGLVPDYENIQRSRLRVDARKWIAAKLKPKKYSESSKVELSGHFAVSQMTDDDLRREVQRGIAAVEDADDLV